MDFSSNFDEGDDMADYTQKNLSRKTLGFRAGKKGLGKTFTMRMDASQARQTGVIRLAEMLDYVQTLQIR